MRLVVCPVAFKPRRLLSLLARMPTRYMSASEQGFGVAFGKAPHAIQYHVVKMTTPTHSCAIDATDGHTFHSRAHHPPSSPPRIPVPDPNASPYPSLSCALRFREERALEASDAPTHDMPCCPQWLSSTMANQQEISSPSAQHLLEIPRPPLINPPPHQCLIRPHSRALPDAYTTSNTPQRPMNSRRSQFRGELPTWVCDGTGFRQVGEVP